MTLQLRQAIAAMTGVFLLTFVGDAAVAQNPVPPAAAQPAPAENPLLKEAQQRGTEGKLPEALAARRVMAATSHNINTAFSQRWARKYLRQ
jgi:hypothetical protein